LDALLADSRLTLGLVDGVSYGPELDAKIKRSGNQLMLRTVTTTNMVHMLAAGRASFIFVDRNDWDHLRMRDKELSALVQHDLPDMPPGLKRYIWCSRDVPQHVIARLNQAIKTLPRPLGPDGR